MVKNEHGCCKPLVPGTCSLAINGWALGRGGGEFHHLVTGDTVQRRTGQRGLSLFIVTADWSLGGLTPERGADLASDGQYRFARCGRDIAEGQNLSRSARKL